MDSNLSDKLSAFGMAIFTVATVPASLPTTALGVLGITFTLPAIFSHFSLLKADQKQVAVKNASKKVLADYRAYVKSGEVDSATLPVAVAALSGVINNLEIQPDLFSNAGWDETKIADLVLQAAMNAAPHDYAEGTDPQIKSNCLFFVAMWTATFKALKSAADFESKVMPAFRRDVMQHLVVLPDMDNKLDQVLALLNASESRANAKAQGVSEATLIALAKRIAASVEHVEQAWAELEQAVVIAIQVKNDGARGRNFGSDLDEIFARLAKLTDDGLLDEAAIAAEKAISEWEDQHSEMQAKGIALLDAGIRQDILRRNAKSAGEKIEQKVRIETATPEEKYIALRAVRNEYYDRARIKGSVFDLQLAIEVGRQVLLRAFNVESRGDASYKLANALCLLGERLAQMVLLKESVTFYRAALLDWTFERNPLMWAAIQNNIGTALISIGKTEEGIASFQRAILDLNAALKVFNRFQFTLEWAMTMFNIGNAKFHIAEREDKIENLLAAIGYYQQALAERTRAKVPIDWAETQNSLGNAYHLLAQRTNNFDVMLRATIGFGEALEEVKRKTSPVLWAIIHLNLAHSLYTIGKSTRSKPSLEEAIVSYDLALEVFIQTEFATEWAAATSGKGITQFELAELARDIVVAKEALFNLQKSAKFFRQIEHWIYAEAIKRLIPAAEALIKKLGG